MKRAQTDSHRLCYFFGAMLKRRLVENAKQLTELARLGHIKKSFIPNKVFREMRTIAKRYQKITAATARQINFAISYLIGPVAELVAFSAMYEAKRQRNFAGFN